MSDTGQMYRKPSNEVERTSSINIENIRAAARRIESYAVVTPLLESPVLNARVGGRVLLKAEVLQRTGSFKLRGALNRIARLSKAELPAVSWPILLAITLKLFRSQLDCSAQLL
jgi:hypothetical protein